MLTEEYDTFRSTSAMEEGAWQGWQFGPTLVRNGEAAKDVKAQGRNPRCILGYYEPGHYCIVMIDGRQKGYSIGMNFSEMIDLSLRLGLTEAYNLDGGGSAIMVFNGEIINQPSGTGDARKLPDMVVIGNYLAPEQLFIPTPSPTLKPAPSPEDTAN
jgi:exopolysaccharide biosynthesis protein